MRCVSSEPKAPSRIDLVGDILDALDRTTPNRRAATLAAAGLKYSQDQELTEFAVPLMKLSEPQLNSLQSSATLTAIRYRNGTDHARHFDSRDRQACLDSVQEISRMIADDAGLTTEDQAHLQALVENLRQALQGSYGPNATEAAAKAIVGDSVVSPGVWGRVGDRPWVKKLATVVAAVLVATGHYGDVKEIALDVSTALHRPLAIQAGSHAEEVVDGEIVEEAGG